MRKSNANELLAVARSAAYARGDFEKVTRCDAQATRRQETKRSKIRRGKERRTAARAYIA